MEREGGGVVCYIKSHLNFSLIESEHEESIWVRINNSDNSFVLGMVYRPPDSNLEQDSTLVSDICKSRNWSKVCIVGDFNLPYIDWVNLVFNGRNRILESLLDCYFFQLVEEPTRGNNILDLVLSNSLNFVKNVQVLDPLGQSDHNSIRFSLSFKSIEVNINKKNTSF